MSRILPSTLEVVRRQLNQFLQNASRRQEDWVIMGSPVELDGSSNNAALNSIMMVVVNIGREAGQGGSPAVQLDLTVDLGFMSNFASQNYKDGLVALSLVIACFQQQPLLTQSSHPDLDGELSKVSLEMLNQSPADLNHIFGTMGCKYLPSVFCRLRVLPYRSVPLQPRALPVRGGTLDEPALRR